MESRRRCNSAMRFAISWYWFSDDVSNRCDGDGSSDTRRPLRELRAHSAGVTLKSSLPPPPPGTFCELCLTSGDWWCCPIIICRNPGELICPLDSVGEFTLFRCPFFYHFTGIIIVIKKSTELPFFLILSHLQGTDKWWLILPVRRKLHSHKSHYACPYTHLSLISLETWHLQLDVYTSRRCVNP